MFTVLYGTGIRASECAGLTEKDINWEQQTIHVIGKGGQMLKKIGSAARYEIEKRLATKVFLELFVKVRPGWRDSPGFVEGLDWRRQLEDLAGKPQK